MAVFRCKEPFSYTDADGTPISVGVGDVMFEGDPELAKRKQFFEHIGVEEATAEPGGLRSLTRRRGRPPKTPPPQPTPPPEPEPAAQPEPESSTPEEA